VPEKSEEFWKIALAVNASFKGLLGSMGESGHICAYTKSVEADLDLEAGWNRVLSDLVALARPMVEDGDVLVVADKVVAASLGRTTDGIILTNPDPKTVSEDIRVTVQGAKPRSTRSSRF
jgi:hypothetical protein